MNKIKRKMGNWIGDVKVKGMLMTVLEGIRESEKRRGSRRPKVANR